MLLRLSVQAVIPKSVTPEYIQKNTELDFVLSNKDIYMLSLLFNQEKYAWDPKTVF